MSDDQKEAVWNVTRACFWLLAFIIISDILVAYIAYFGCLYVVVTKLAPPDACKDGLPDLKELLVGGLAVVLAFSGRGTPK